MPVSHKYPSMSLSTTPPFTASHSISDPFVDMDQENLNPNRQFKRQFDPISLRQTLKRCRGNQVTAPSTLSAGVHPLPTVVLINCGLSSLWVWNVILLSLLLYDFQIFYGGLTYITNGLTYSCSYGDTKQGFPESRLCKASSTVIAHQLVMLGHLFLVTSFGLDFILGCDSLQATFLSDILSSNAQGSYILIEKPVN
ncbi:hypothetical protein G4B88_022209 [Cannabis sativa]|uniref:Uncharacterized protein n=1 Tax=Cannabis sativa TaxID=3483 RepID=A0A7J6FY91_CANSA|nr:hypothetical protein G4B88_022209 [Cannabis sativa]